MLLAADVGNTEITLGQFTGDHLEACWRVTTVVPRTPHEWAALLTSFLNHAGRSTDEVRAAIVASVAPGVTEVIAEGIALAFGNRPRLVSAESKLPIVLDVEEPHTVGADRIVNTLAAARVFRRDTIVVDFGTATTFDCITADGTFLGGVIAPGVWTAAENLIRKAAKLPATELIAPERAIGRRTEDCIRSGVLYGAVDAVDGIVRRIKREWPTEAEPLVVATGGLAERVGPLCTEVDEIDADLTLKGLRIAAECLGMKW
jgi:type III pantothenate kinase